MKTPHSWSRRTNKPDALMEELITALMPPFWTEFKPLFLTVHVGLRARKAANGGEEMLRLRIYEKLQNLLRIGGVEKTGKEYRAVPAGLALVMASMAADQSRSLPPRASVAEPEPAATA